MPLPLALPFTLYLLGEDEDCGDYAEWMESCLAPVTLVAASGGHLSYADFSIEAVQARFLEVCQGLRALGTVSGVDEAEEAISTWAWPAPRDFPTKIFGHATVAPNIAALKVCGFEGLGLEPFRRIGHGDAPYVEQIVSTSNAVFDERAANPPSLANRLFPRTPDLNLYCPATVNLRTALKLHPETDNQTRRDIGTALQMLDRQPGYGIELRSKAQLQAVMGAVGEERPAPNPVITMRQKELWLGTEAIASLAASEVSAVVRLPNRLNHSRGAVRQFAQHYRADRPRILKRREMFRRVQQAIARGVPVEFRELINRSQDGIRIIADAHLEWLDVDGFPLGLRHNVSRIPVTPGNAFIDTLAVPRQIYATPEDFHDILVVSGLREGDAIARQFEIAFAEFGREWRETVRIKFVLASSKQELVDAMNSFGGLLMVFDGHGSHRADQPGVLWLDDEAVDIWSLKGEVQRSPPIIVLSACDTHAADRNHATTASGFLALGSRAVLASVFPLHASEAAVFAARLLYRVSEFVPAAIGTFGRTLTWLEVVSGMLRRQLATDILRRFEALGLLPEQGQMDFIIKVHGLADFADDPLSSVKDALIDLGIPLPQLEKAIGAAIASSSTISYLHIGRPETILIGSQGVIKAIQERPDHVSTSAEAS